jgi:two-component system chemotaxis response regulator CheY
MPSVLVVDDSSTMRQYIGGVFRKAGFEVLVAEHGLAGLEVLRSQARVDAIVADVHMPRMSGLEMLAAHAAGGRLDRPAFVLTAESGSTSVDTARAMGVAGWFVKPFQPDTLVEAVRAALR